MAITLNMEVMELVYYYWQATSEGEKVGEAFIMTIADHEKMKPVYSKGFTPESVRRALSAISNKEKFSAENKTESRFWNNNMWAMEDLGLMELMMAPLKVMNLDDIEVQKPLEIVVLPLHLDDYYLTDNTLYLNFFRVQADLMGMEPLKMDGIELKQWIRQVCSG
ncbi:TDE2712 family protein [Spongorhabdus nitratireducens]